MKKGPLTPANGVKLQPHRLMNLKNWELHNRDVETGQDYYTPLADENPKILSTYGERYGVVGFYSRGDKIEWIMCERFTDNGTLIEAQLTPDTIAEMKCGYSDDPELAYWLTPGVGLKATA